MVVQINTSPVPLVDVSHLIGVVMVITIVVITQMKRVVQCSNAQKLSSDAVMGSALVAAGDVTVMVTAKTPQMKMDAVSLNYV